MYKIVIKGKAKTQYPYLKELDGIDCIDNFADYFDETSYSHNIEEGYMDFRYEDKKLWTYTTYTSDKELNPEELEHLANYTQGQWSDGIGEGFEQFPCYVPSNDEEDGEVYISPWFSGQVLTVIQTPVTKP
jgi:hypothetical protein